MAARTIAILGTGSHVGKTTVVAGLLRALSNRGHKVAPFKAQNMSLESVVTADGGEIARATAMQARAARQIPTIDMNPILLKPRSDTASQLILHGKPAGDATARDYFGSPAFQSRKEEAIAASIARMRETFDILVAEGAGSCAEPNLLRYDVVNFGAVHRLDADAYVVTDIDKGGSFAELLGTVRILERLAPEHAKKIRGFVINKFRGDVSLLAPAIDFLQTETGIPVVGVLPYLPLDLEEEDRLTETLCAHPEIDIAAIHLPHVSNAADLDALAREENVRVRWIKSPAELGRPDAIVIPGTRNTTGDLDHLRRIGLAGAILERQTTPIVGICGGYEMLGSTIADPEHLESELGTIEGLRLLDVDFAFAPGKVLRNGSWTPTEHNPYRSAIEGYEIHSGLVTRHAERPLYESENGTLEGAISADGRVLGTFVHDLFSNGRFTRSFVNGLRSKKGLPPLSGPIPDLAKAREESLERLAASIEENAPALLHACLQS